MDEILPRIDTPLVTGQADPTPPGETDLGRDTFLKLLTEQLQNQDPLDPMKNEDFVAQLAQFSSLEQLFGLQETMNAVYLGIASMNNATMSSLLGTEVVARGNAVSYSGEGSVDLHFDSAGAFEAGTVTIQDANGTVVNTLAVGSQTEGEFSVMWDGTDLDGQSADEGDYTFSISATSSEGETIDVETLIVGVVDEMDYSTGTPQPSVGGIVVDIGAILRLQEGGSNDEVSAQ